MRRKHEENTESRPARKRRRSRGEKKGISLPFATSANPKLEFVKTFLAFFVVVTIVMMPVRFGLAKVGEVRIFGGSESIMGELDYLVDQNSPFYEQYANQQRVNVLVLGDNDGLTDTIMLASYDMENQKLDVISVPRDTYYPRKDHKGAAAQKINSIYGSDGAVGTAKAVSEVLMGIPINYYAVIEFSDVEKIVDQIGGVPMDIPFTMKYDDPYDKPPLHIYIEKGQQTLDGKKAVQFLRFRKGYPDQDIGRVRAQQTFIKSAVKQAIGPNLVGTVKLGLQEIDSDITLGMATKIATKALGLDAENMNTYMAPGAAKTVNGASYWFVDTAATGELLEEIYNQSEEASKSGGTQETEE